MMIGGNHTLGLSLKGLGGSHPRLSLPGTCMIAGRSLHVLYHSGATHSFVSESKVVELGLPLRELQFHQVVSTPAFGLVRTSTVCVRCLIEVEGHKYRVNLIYLPMEGLDVILGMD